MSAIATSVAPTQALPYRVWDAWKRHPDHFSDPTHQVHRCLLELEDDGITVQVAATFDRHDEYPVEIQHVWTDGALTHDLLSVLDPLAVGVLEHKWYAAHIEFMGDA